MRKRTAGTKNRVTVEKELKRSRKGWGGGGCVGGGDLGCMGSCAWDRQCVGEVGAQSQDDFNTSEKDIHCIRL